MDGELGFEIDHEDGLVTVTGTGMWSAAHAAAHFQELERAVLKLRREHGSVRVLVNLRGAAVQTRDTAAVMRAWTGRIYRVADRVAVVCATALLALQIKRHAEIDTMATFHELAAAQAWVGLPATSEA